MSTHALDNQLPERLINKVAELERQLRELRTLQLNSANAIQIVGVPDDYMDIDDIAAAGQELTYNFQIFPAGNILTNWDLYFTVYVDLPDPPTPNNSYRYPAGGALSAGQAKMRVTSWPDYAKSFDASGMRWFNVNVKNEDSVSHHIYIIGKFYGPYALQETET